MRKFAYISFLLLAPSLFVNAQQKIIVACIGNSITYGYLVHDREHNSYPAQLQAMLGNGYEVMNFGSSGKTAMHVGGNAYIDTKQYRDAINSKANIVLIKLGTNDSRPYYRKYIDSFYADYKSIVRTFKALPTHPRVILLYPVVNYLLPKAGDPFNMDIPKFIIPVIDRVAAEEQCEKVDLHSVLIGHPEMFTDKMHPDSAGAGMIARKLYEFLTPVKKSGMLNGSKSNIPLQKPDIINRNVPKYWKRSHDVYSHSQTNIVGNTI